MRESRTAHLSGRPSEGVAAVASGGLARQPPEGANHHALPANGGAVSCCPPEAVMIARRDFPDRIPPVAVSDQNSLAPIGGATDGALTPPGELSGGDRNQCLPHGHCTHA